MGQNYPNPFNPSTTINYQLPKDGQVSLKIFDMLGKEIMTVVNQVQQAGMYSVQVDASRLSTGLCFYELCSGEFRNVKKMIVVK